MDPRVKPEGARVGTQRPKIGTYRDGHGYWVADAAGSAAGAGAGVGAAALAGAGAGAGAGRTAAVAGFFFLGGGFFAGGTAGTGTSST